MVQTQIYWALMRGTASAPCVEPHEVDLAIPADVQAWARSVDPDFGVDPDLYLVLMPEWLGPRDMVAYRPADLSAESANRVLAYCNTEN